MKVVIELNNKETMPIGEDRVLLYDKGKKEFYTTSREDLILAYVGEFEKHKTYVDEKVEHLENSYNEFLTQYKEANEKIIKLIKSFVGEGDN